ncbi:MAG: ISL3 family transposase [Bdellovibrionales bacterium]|nr:ISL3 family transposase [Bdellovibrionales bacterium]
MNPIWKSTEKFILLPELKLLTHWQSAKFRTHYKCRKDSQFEVCPKCATKSYSVHDRRWVTIRDQPIRGSGIELRVLKRRFRCPGCRKVFTEPLNGVRKGFKTTERFRRGLRWAADNFADIDRAQRAYGCSAGLVYKVFYEQLDIKWHERMNDPWGRVIGIDEHSWKKCRKNGFTEFASLIVDYDRNRIAEVVNGKTVETMKNALSYIPGRERVEQAVIDMCDPFRKFISEFFPNAIIVADKFHVLRLMSPLINKARMEITGDKRKNPVRRLLLKNRNKLKYYERNALDLWLVEHPKLKEIYWFKEALHRLYRTRGSRKAEEAFMRLTDSMALSQLKEIKKLRKTLMKWRKEILNYFITRLTNGKTEGYNRLAKLYQYRAFAFRNFFNYRLRLLNA